MKAIVFTEYGAPEVLRMQEQEKPTPKENEILVRIRATSVNIGDVWARNFQAISPSKFSMPLPLWFFARMYFGLTKPRVNVLGSEFAGQVEAVGDAVKRFKKGDAVFGYRGQSMGANVEYLCVTEDSLVARKPTNMTFEQAATIPYGALTALSLLRKVNIQRGQHILINGASGGIGSAAVQLAKYFGATVTGVCSTPRMELVKQLGADYVMDYTRADFTKNGETYDVIFDVMNKSSFARVKHSLKLNGRYLLASFKLKQVFQMLWTSKFGDKKVICAFSNESPKDLEFVRELAEQGKLQAVIDRCYPLEQAADAHRYFETGRKRASVVLTMGAA